MFIPLYDRNPHIRIERPYATYGIMVLCVFVFLYQVSEGSRFFQQSVFAYGAVPALVFGKLQAEPWMVNPWLSLLTASFLHGSWWHLIANMLFLRVFGDNVEDAMGHGRFLAFYLICGVGAILGHTIAQPDSMVPVVGASGAISGVMGAYLLLHPRSSILTLIGWIPIPLPAWLLLIVWIGFQMLSAAAAAGSAGGVAWWAHIGGFFLGMALTPFFKRGTAPYGGIHGIKKGIRLRRRDEDDEERRGPWN